MFSIVIIQIEYTANHYGQTLSQPRPWCNDSGVLNLYRDVKVIVSSQLSVTWYKSTNQDSYRVWNLNNKSVYTNSTVCL